MYSQAFAGSNAYGGSGYGMDYQQPYYYQQHQQQKQQMIAGIMGYYSPEAAAMFYNPYNSYAQGQPAQMQSQYAQPPQQQLDYQLTPALYLLNQQAELLQKSLVKTNTKKSTEAGPASAKPQRKQRGPYKRRTNKTLSPTVSPAPDFEMDNTERLSSSDLSGSNNRSTGSIEAVSVNKTSSQQAQHYQQQQQQQRKRKSDSFLDVDQQQTVKQTRTLCQKQSIFRDVTMMAISSCAQHV
uniref:Uncharacterized protein n=1 Tax=Anopheles dirus TaxID=7168 RepID=A0A182NTI8_9DIPT